MSKIGRGIVFIVFGIAMVLASLLLTFMYEKREADAGHYAEVLMSEFTQAEVPSATITLPSPGAKENEATDSATAVPVPEMATADFNGLQMLGVIRVPSCGIELPILDDWDMTMLEYAPCRYLGNVYSDDLIVMGHNYATHFKPLRKVAVGAEVEFETVDGFIWRYCVERIDSIHRNEPEKLPSDHELILFTCEKYGVSRFVARCSLVEIIDPNGETWDEPGELILV